MRDSFFSGIKLHHFRERKETGPGPQYTVRKPVKRFVHVGLENTEAWLTRFVFTVEYPSLTVMMARKLAFEASKTPKEIEIKLLIYM